MRVTVLGSSGGYPAPGRACSGFLIEGDSSRLWVDAGSGTLARLLETCPLSALDAALLSHIHPDHWTDLPLAIHALRLGAYKRDLPLPIYGPPGWVEAMGITVQWALEDPVPAFIPNDIRVGLELEFAGMRVEPFRMRHSDVEIFGFRGTDAGRPVAYSADSAPCEALVALSDRADLFICEAGSPDSTESRLHLNARQAGGIAAKSNVGRLLLTHLRPDDDPQRAARDAASVFDGPVEVAQQGATYVVG